MRHTGRFRTPPAADPIGAAKDSSLTFRLNLGFFLGQAAMFLVIDLLVFALLGLGLTGYAEDRCAAVAEAVAEYGLPDPESARWMESGACLVTPLDRPAEGLEIPAVLSRLPFREDMQEGLRSVKDGRYYVVELPNNGTPYAIRVDMLGPFRTLHRVMTALLICQVLFLLLALFRNARTIRLALYPIQSLAAAAARFNAAKPSTARDALENLTDELGKINASRLDSRIDLPGTQKELRPLAQAINEMLDRLNQAYGAQMRFVSDASHELRTPIAVIQGYASLLSRWGKSDPDTLEESINAIRDEAQSMERLVEQLLFLARGDNESQPVNMEPLDLTRLAAEVLREEEMIHPQRTYLPRWEEAAPVTVLADPGLIKQLMRILLDNSVKYSPPEGLIYLRVNRSGDYARVTVQDEGMGILPEAMPHIFERFYRTDRSRTRKTGGTGLGLSIAHWIVKRHGGWFEIVSRVDVGTRITFVLPLEENHEVQEEMA